MTKEFTSKALFVCLFGCLGSAQAATIDFQSAAEQIFTNSPGLDPVYLSELSNADVTFGNVITNIPGQVPQAYPAYGIQPNVVAFIGSGSFTATFSQPVNQVVFDIYSFPFLGSFEYGNVQDDRLSAVYKDSNGQVIGTKTVTVPYSLDTGPDYSPYDPSAPPPVFNSQTPFSSITFDWTTGTTGLYQHSDLYDCGNSPTNCSWITPVVHGFAPNPEGGNNVLAGVGFGYSFAEAVPEPETYALMLAGLGLMGWVTRDRRPQN